jgi:hypothetical protein
LINQIFKKNYFTISNNWQENSVLVDRKLIGMKKQSEDFSFHLSGKIRNFAKFDYLII